MKTRKIFILLILLFVLPAVHTKAQQPMLQINTKDNSIRFNNQIIAQPYTLKQIVATLGKPDRVETQIRKSRYEEHDYKGEPSTSTIIKVTDTYHIYDALGLVFFTSASLHKSGNKKIIIYFRKRSFTNTRKLAFVPQKAFSGKLQINGKAVPVNDKLVPQNVDYNTDKFELWGTSFGAASISTKIDRLYSQQAKPYLMFYLDAVEAQRVSYVEIVGKHY